ncbi:MULTISPECIES: hypothetical protein [Pseudomonas]|uniref:hypothetical protein n=1 Tax=Pseudomonas TaxID=286 RepID=UPI003EBB0EEC
MSILKYKAGLFVLALGGTIINLSSSQATERDWSFSYNNKGLLASSDGPRTDVSDITRYEYDAKGNLARVINALDHVTAISEYDAVGNPSTIVDPNGAVTRLTYAPQGWVTSMSTSAGTTRFEYNAVGDTTKLLRGNGSWLAYTWDDARRLVRIDNNQGERMEFELDSMGNRTAIRLKDITGNITKQHQWAYDELGRLLHSVGTGGHTSRTQYDLNDNPIRHTNPRQHIHTATYDSLNRLVKKTDPLFGVTQFEYDAQDNLTQIIDPRSSITQYHYDGLGNLTLLTSPDSGTSTYEYDGAGNITKKTDARGTVTILAYDALNRLTNRRYPANQALDVQFHYDSTAAGNNGVGRLTGVQDISGLLNYTYDADGNVSAQRHSVQVGAVTHQEQLGYGYDRANRLSRIDYPTGVSILYVRNTAGQVSQLQIRHGTETPTAFASNIKYQPFGPLKSLSWANGTTLQRTYDLDYRLTAQIVAGQNTTIPTMPSETSQECITVRLAISATATTHWIAWQKKQMLPDGRPMPMTLWAIAPRKHSAP